MRVRKHPPLLRRGPFSGCVFVVTRYIDRGDGCIEATEKWDVTDEFNAITAEEIERLTARLSDIEAELPRLVSCAAFYSRRLPSEQSDVPQWVWDLVSDDDRPRIGERPTDHLEKEVDALTARVAELEACLADIGRHNEPGGEGQ